MSAPELEFQEQARASREPPVIPVSSPQQTEATASSSAAAADTGGQQQQKGAAKGLSEQLDTWQVSNLPEEKTFFGMDPNVLEAAVSATKARLSERDSHIRNAWLLTEIDHWDLEKERVVLLSDNNLISVKYNFVVGAVETLKYIPLQFISRMVYGEFKYTSSYVFNRRGKGLKVYWGSEDTVGFFSRWNPFSDRIPYTIFASHSLVRRGRTDDPKLMISKAYGDIEKAIQDYHRANSQSAEGGEEFKVENGDVVFDTYLGMTALVHNQSHLGFFKRRGLVDW